MRCPSCGAEDISVIETRARDEGASVRRRRECSSCGHRCTTFEVVIERRADDPYTVRERNRFYWVVNWIKEHANTTQLVYILDAASSLLKSKTFEEFDDQPVRCKTTGEMFPSATVAARLVGLHDTQVRQAINRNGIAAGYEWEYVPDNEYVA